MNHPLVLITLIAFGVIGCSDTPKEQTSRCDIEVEHNTTDGVADIERELAQLRDKVRHAGSPRCCQKYIEEVIAEGSNVLHLKAGPMDGGYASPEDAPKIASYVLTLSGREALYPHYVQEGNMLYNGNCGGCHGDDGKGLGGAYPDLTLPLFRGAQLRKEQYEEEIVRLEDELIKQRHGS